MECHLTRSKTEISFAKWFSSVFLPDASEHAMPFQKGLALGTTDAKQNRNFLSEMFDAIIHVYFPALSVPVNV